MVGVRFETKSKGRGGKTGAVSFRARFREDPCMSASFRRLAFGIAAAGALALSACTSNTPAPQEAAAPPAMTAPAIPSKYRPEDIVGRWGYGAFHKDEDLARTAAAARAQCGQPVEITRGPNGGVMMYLADSATLQELQLKGSQNGANYIGPPGDP